MFQFIRGEQIMANANRRFGLFTFATFTTATAAALTVAALTVAALAYQPDLGAGSIALSIGTATPISDSSLDRRADRMAANQLAVFLRDWTNTAGGEQ
jgi:hypothetical protein